VSGKIFKPYLIFIFFGQPTRPLKQGGLSMLKNTQNNQLNTFSGQ